MSSSNIISRFSRPRFSGFFLFSFLFLVALAPILFLFPQNVYALDITLAWDANSEEDLAGYRVFCREEGESYNYNDPAWEGDKTETSCTIYNLDDHTTYCFVVRAFDTSNNESGDSNEVCYQPNMPPTALNGLSIGGASSVTENTTSSYTATATFSNGSTQSVTESASWSEDSSYATINSNGGLSTSDLTGDHIVTITASYTLDGVTKTAQKVVTIIDVPESNLAPLDPVVTSPYYDQVECDLLLLITTEPFSDPDGDLHSQSQWQISKQADFASTILDVTKTVHLTKLPVPHTLLKPYTTYYVRVRFYDVYLEPSDWSDVTSDAIKFTTASYNNDVDENGVPGIPDDQEVDNSVDLNGDGTPDNNQPELIKCIQSVLGNATIGVCKASDSITAIEAVETIDPSTISDKIKRPKKFLLGLFSYRLSVNEPGATATVRVYFSEGISKARTFFKYDTINGWQDYSLHTTFGKDGRSVILEVKDGGYGDSDGIANGFIVDPGGLATAGSSMVETSGSYNSGCFIATAAFGSYAEPHVKLLSDFRDQRLITNMPGRWFVRMYYRYSPFWADLINIHTWCKPVVRLALMPLVGISYVLIKASVVTSILAGLMLALFVLGCLLRMHGRPLTGGEQP